MPHDDLRLKVALGKGNLGEADNKVVRWSQLIDLLAKPLVDTAITLTDYLKLSATAEGREEQNRRKGMPGFLVGGTCAGRKRTLKAMTTRSLVCLDIDEATPQQAEWLFSHSPLRAFEFVAHITRKHTDRKPRWRLIFPLSRQVDHDEFNAVSRILAAMTAADQDDAMAMVDDVSFRMAQIMYLPSVSFDQTYDMRHNEGDLVDPDALLGAFEGDWRDFTQLPYSPDRGAKRATDPRAKAEDPTTKHGYVGAFCRAFDVEEAIAEFLPDVYAPSDVVWTKPRYTYLPGSGANGAEVQDDGLFLYSHHGTDPCSDRLVNSFDLVRIHLFKPLDEDAREDTSPTALPSYKAMVEFIRSIEAVRDELVQDRYDVALSFDDLDEEDDGEDNKGGKESPRDDLSDILGPESPDDSDDASPFDDLGPPPDAKPKDADRSWQRELQVNDKGVLIPSLPTLVVILRNDPRTKNVMRLNEFSGEVVRKGVLRSKNAPIHKRPVRNPIMGDIWSGYDDAAVRIILGMSRDKGGYDLRNIKGDITDAVNEVALQNGFHPVKERVESVRWDGVERAGRLFIDYLGSPDTPYIREVTRLVLLGAITRIYEPGHKFDFVAVLEGRQGAGKSTFIDALAWGFFAELDGPVSDRNKCVEQMQDAWLVEIPELSGFNRGEVNEIKSLISARKDKVRLAYEKRAAMFWRQSIFLGTSNDRKYLKDMTGGRRFWPVEVTVEQIDNPRLREEVGLVWAEVLTWYRDMRKAQPKGMLPLYLRNEAAQAEAFERQEDRRILTQEDEILVRCRDWLDTPVPRSEVDPDTSGFDDEDASDDEGSPELGLRDLVFTEELWTHALGQHASDCLSKSLYHQLTKALPQLEGWERTRNGVKVNGKKPRRGYRRKGTAGERWRPIRSLPPNDDDILG